MEQPINEKKARLIALYLPQYHPIPENDEWWGKGFTEWTNTAKAKPLFKGHYQPHIPADLGFYDLRIPETRIAQAEMAHHHGIEGFCYYHYWFGGRQILERPFNEVLASGQPDFPFCLCWANQTWTGIWHGAPNRVLIEQTYPGMEDHIAHFNYLLPAFLDHRYLCIDNKPIFIVYQPKDLPQPKAVTDLWREMALKAGLPGLFLIAQQPPWLSDPISDGFDAAFSTFNLFPPRRGDKWVSWKTPITRIKNWYYEKRQLPTIHDYRYLIKNPPKDFPDTIESYPCVIPNWDNTPRSGANGLVLNNSTPELFRIHLKDALNKAKQLPDGHRLIFIKSWNEWAEGNHLEPDLRFGRQYLEVIKEELGKIDAT